MKSIKGKTKFYHFDQNNSGGDFVVNDDVCHHVFIEAHSVEEANLLADNFGIYFDGCNTGEDCSCCGDRWHPVSNYDGKTKPKIYGVDVRKAFEGMFNTDCIIHYLNGKKEHIIFKTVKDCPKHIWEQKYDIGRKCKTCHVWESES